MGYKWLKRLNGSKKKTSAVSIHFNPNSTGSRPRDVTEPKGVVCASSTGFCNGGHHQCLMSSSLNLVGPSCVTRVLGEATTKPITWKPMRAWKTPMATVMAFFKCSDNTWEVQRSAICCFINWGGCEFRVTHLLVQRMSCLGVWSRSLASGSGDDPLTNAQHGEQPGWWNRIRCTFWTTFQPKREGTHPLKGLGICFCIYSAASWLSQIQLVNPWDWAICPRHNNAAPLTKQQLIAWPQWHRKPSLSSWKGFSIQIDDWLCWWSFHTNGTCPKSKVDQKQAPSSTLESLWGYHLTRSCNHFEAQLHDYSHRELSVLPAPAQKSH